MNTPLNDAPTREQLIAFLDGSGTIDGVSYGERHPTERGLCWWRKYLPILANTPESSNSTASNGAAQGSMTAQQIADALPTDWFQLAQIANAVGHEYWKAAVRERGQGAVQWLQSDDGSMFVFTRGEYRDQMEKFLLTLPFSQTQPAAQPSDATAQPSLSDIGESERLADLSLKPVDLTDEHLGKIASEAFHHALAGGHMFDLYKMPKRSELRGLLANTNAQHSPAQGKPK